MQNKYPEVIVFAGPNGSGKTTITKLARVVEPYINADDIKRTTLCTDLDAARKAEELREKAVSDGSDFTFETVLSTERNLNLLKKAKAQGYFVRCIYVLTADVEVNLFRIEARKADGGHDVPEEKVRERYIKALKLIPELVEVCDVMHIYDNTNEPFRIFKKRKDKFFSWPNENWSAEHISELTGIEINALVTEKHGMWLV